MGDCNEESRAWPAVSHWSVRSHMNQRVDDVNEVEVSERRCKKKKEGWRRRVLFQFQGNGRVRGSA